MVACIPILLAKCQLLIYIMIRLGFYYIVVYIFSFAVSYGRERECKPQLLDIYLYLLLDKSVMLLSEAAQANWKRSQEFR